MTDTCRGIDVSSHQGDQDWSVHKENGVVFAFAKASEGQRSRDGQFSTHIRGIRESGLVPGAYHFGWPNQPVEAEVSNYVAAVRPYSGSGFVHWLDLERYPDGRNYSGVSDVQIRSWAEQWVSLVGKAFPDQRVGVYSSGTDIGRGRVPEDVPLWYPEYPGASVNTYAEAEKTVQPTVSGRRPLFWQFTSDPATGPNLDLNICYLSAAALRDWAAGSEGDDMPTASEIAESVWSKDGEVNAARPPYANADYASNPSWSAGYALQASVEAAREAASRAKECENTLNKVLSILSGSSGPTDAQLTAAAQAGAQAALKVLGTKLSG